MKSNTSFSSKLGVKVVILQISKPFPGNFRKCKLMPLALSDIAAFTRTCNGRFFDFASDFGSERFFGP